MVITPNKLFLGKNLLRLPNNLKQEKRVLIQYWLLFTNIEQNTTLSNNLSQIIYWLCLEICTEIVIFSPSFLPLPKFWGTEEKFQLWPSIFMEKMKKLWSLVPQKNTSQTVETDGWNNGTNLIGRLGQSGGPIMKSW